MRDYSFFKKIFKEKKFLFFFAVFLWIVNLCASFLPKTSAIKLQWFCFHDIYEFSGAAFIDSEAIKLWISSEDKGLENKKP